MTVRVRLPLPPEELSPNRRPHWAAKSAATARARANAHVMAKSALRGSLPFMTCASVSVVFDVSVRAPGQPFRQPGYRPRDEQNAVASLKAYVDGCVDAGVLKDDSAKHLKWGEVRIVRERNPGVVMTFEGEPGGG